MQNWHVEGVIPVSQLCLCLERVVAKSNKQVIGKFKGRPSLTENCACRNLNWGKVVDIVFCIKFKIRNVSKQGFQLGFASPFQKLSMHLQ